MESKRKEYFVGQKSYIKGKGLDPRAEYLCIPPRRGIRLPDAPVSYTHLTLPTIYSV